MRCVRVVWVLAALAAAAGAVRPAGAGEPAAVDLRAGLARLAAAPWLGRIGTDRETLRQFYAGRSWQTAWLAGPDPHRRALLAAAVLEAAPRDGLDPDDYAYTLIRRMIADGRGAELDIALSAALARFGTDLQIGRLSPGDHEAHGDARQPRMSGVTILERAAALADPKTLFTDLSPQTPQYRRLRRALAKFRSVVRRGGWPPVPEGPVLRTGDSGARVTALRRRLAAGGDLPQSAASGDLFDDRLARVVKRFQRRHGLRRDGIVGRNTLDALNTTAEARVRQIRLNLERRRWMPEDLGRRYVFVNTADFALKLVDGDHTRLTMRVVAGTPFWRTPVFTGTMTYLEFSPYWNVPPSIARNEILPKVRDDPAYLAQQGIRVLGLGDKAGVEFDPTQIDWLSGAKPFPYRLRQDPGPKNPLGRVKFMFPNQFNVYLHDTPSRDLFDKPTRAFSHGCIRIEHPEALALYLLHDQEGWSAAAVHEAMSGSERRVVRLAQPLPVHITYITAWANKDGSIHFRNDVYGRDKRLAAALFRGQPAGRSLGQ